ncbi:MAG: hypothetical protein N4A40_12845 [Tissierellales bacterium]|jgi:hypothetical protein|nr:hypothetical protein [Tissierellales bacterium]
MKKKVGKKLIVYTKNPYAKLTAKDLKLSSRRTNNIKVWVGAYNYNNEKIAQRTTYYSASKSTTTEKLSNLKNDIEEVYQELLEQLEQVKEDIEKVEFTIQILTEVLDVADSSLEMSNNSIDKGILDGLDSINGLSIVKGIDAKIEVLISTLSMAQDLEDAFNYSNQSRESLDNYHTKNIWLYRDMQDAISSYEELKLLLDEFYNLSNEYEKLDYSSRKINFYDSIYKYL